MKKEPLVSIIIPTFNRAHLIGETLDSIMAQTYTNWECIIVDDGSTDNTSEIVGGYVEKDPRFQYHHRPKDRLRGGNAARNYGFEVSKGEYVNWFDSDDLMTKEHIYKKYQVILKQNSDFVVAQTQNFRGQTYLDPYIYQKKTYGITLEDFVLRKIGWYTYDVILIRKIAEKIEFNEDLMYWQDFNYFSKMLTFSTKGVYLDEILTHRRLHQNSIQNEMVANKVSFNQKLLRVMDLTYRDIYTNLSEFGKDEIVRGNMNTSFTLARLRKHIPLLKRTISLARMRFGYKASFLFVLSILCVYITKKGEFILKKAKRC